MAPEGDIKHGQSDGQSDHGSSLYAALARTVTRGAALYFSRPVRLFRPSKVSGWMFLQGLASQKGVSLSPQFLGYLVKKHGLFVLPSHFLPPLAINAALGTVLWSSYSQASTLLEGHLIHPLAISLVSGAIAGGSQALVAAPAENVRIVLESGGSHAGWTDAWKDVFRGTPVDLRETKAQGLRDARQVRIWMQDVGDMAGRGWKGLTWGFAKDTCGFAVFFSIFEVTRRISTVLKANSIQVINKLKGEASAKFYVPRVVHGVSLVTGGILAGLAYELTTRPFDEARRIVHAQRVTDPSHRTIVAGFKVLSKKVQEDGLSAFFRSAPRHGTTEPVSRSTSLLRRRTYTALRVLGRLGPWGAGFLIWEMYGPVLAS